MSYTVKSDVTLQNTERSTQDKEVALHFADLTFALLTQPSPLSLWAREGAALLSGSSQGCWMCSVPLVWVLCEIIPVC